MNERKDSSYFSAKKMSAIDLPYMLALSVCSSSAGNADNVTQR